MIIISVQGAICFLYHCHNDYEAVLQIECSHRCYRERSRCVNPSHIIFELRADNTLRNKCISALGKNVHIWFRVCTSTSMELQNAAQALSLNVVSTRNYIVQPSLPFDKLLECFESRNFRRSFSLARQQTLNHVVMLFYRFVKLIKTNDQLHVPARFNYNGVIWIQIVKKLVEHIELPNGNNKCFEWTGRFIKLPRKRPTIAFKQINVAKVLGFLAVKTSETDRLYANELESTASHLCPNMYCVNWSHIQLGSLSYNTSRSSCLNGSIASRPHSPHRLLRQR
ncbi:hypothetical protein M3Y96_00548100 [Aphelenchoides besseyi]|nr:hypothetical protein M3Y96_00548100 [Aphelenchoides besseyi]